VSASAGHRFAFIGFGALAEAFAAGLREGGATDVVAYARPRADGAAAAALAARLAAAGVRARPSIAEALEGADVVVAAVPASAAAGVAHASTPHLRPQAVYVDPAPLSPAAKEALADSVAHVGAQYADVAVLGTVVVDRHRVPMLASGPGAARWAEAATAHGLRVSVLDGAPGRASLVKLLRSVYMKGRDALVLEMVLAARRHGVEDAVMASIGGPGEQVPFPELASRVLTSLAVYAERRAGELHAAAELVADAGVEPLVTVAGAERLRRLGALGLRESFGGERPDNLDTVLAAMDALAPRALAPGPSPPPP
jgi:3-hydroxyisobutyrate dehydrogenase-like beta-hydroxyacid dehydrogenase